MAPANLHVDAVALLDLLKQPQTGLPENLSDFEAGEFLERGEIGQETFDEWLQVERARVRRDVQLSLAEALAHFHAHRDTGNKLRAARTMVSIDPFDEGAHRSIMQALVAEGRAGLAQEHYEEFKRRLSDELGVSPESQTRELYRSICANRSVAREVSTSLSEFAFILEQLPYPVIVTDTASRIVGWNSSSESAFGKLKTEVFGSVPSAVFGEAKPRDRQRDSDEVFQHAVSKGSWSGRAKVRSSDGSVSFVRRLVSPLYSADGELIGAVGQSIHEAIA